jgi:hypothetical protein
MIKFKSLARQAQVPRENEAGLDKAAQFVIVIIVIYIAVMLYGPLMGLMH